MKKAIIIFIFLVTHYSCSEFPDQSRYKGFQPRIIETKGTVFSSDSITEPESVPAGEPRVVIAGQPKVIKTNTNIHPAGKPKKVLAGIPDITEPGKGKYLIPDSAIAISKPFIAGQPEIVLARDAYSKDNNPQSFSSFTKLQGIRHNSITCITQDKSGNLWFGSIGGGFSKFDGKYFTHYTLNEGLSNNDVRAILIDKNGTLLIGTNGGGVSIFDGKFFTNFTVEEGLTSNIVYSIAEDRSGNIWFATSGGVCKYDGKYFTHLTEKNGLSNNDVRSVVIDRNDNLWFGTYGGGINRYDGKSFRHFTRKTGLSSDLVLSVQQDHNGILWFGTEGGGLIKFDGDNFYNYTKNEGLSENTVTTIREDKIGNIWLGTLNHGVCKYSGSQVEVLNNPEESKLGNPRDWKKGNNNSIGIFSYYSVNEGLNNSSITSVFEDVAGNIWIGSEAGGLTKYAGKYFTHFADNDGLTNFYILSILEDKDGNLWFGSNGGGVNKYDGKAFSVYTEKEGLINNTVLSIFQDKAGNIWFGTESGVSKFDGKTFTQYTKKEGLTSSLVWSILEDHIGFLWFATEDGVFRYDGNLIDAIENGANVQFPDSIKFLKINDRLVKSFTRFTTKQGLISDAVRNILQDRNGNFWFGSFGGGVCKFDGKTITHITAKEGLINDYIRSIFEDKAGNIWFANNEGGVTKYDGKYLTFLNDKEGLSNNTAGSIVQDKKGDLWFGTRNGLNKLTERKLARLNEFQKSDMKGSDEVFSSELMVLFKNYLYEDGFLGIGCFSNSICEDRNGTIWIGCNDRLSAYYPYVFEKDTLPPTINLLDLTIFNENINWINLESHKDTSIILGNGAKLKNFTFDSLSKWYNLPVNLSLAYNNNFLTFTMVGTTQSQPQRVKYKYKLEGLDASWSSPTSRNEAFFSNLSQGNYVLKVKAMNSEGYWSKELSYPFTIRPPWWNTWGFRIFIIFIIVGCLISFYRWRIVTLKRQKIILEKSVEEKTREVTSQKEELWAINEELTATNEELVTQKDELYLALKSLKETQNQLLQSEKMASLGVLAAGVAHEINNPLNFIKGGIMAIESFIKEKLGDNLSEVKPLINGIHVGVNRAASIVTSLNHYSRMSDNVKIDCDIHQIIDNCLVILQGEIKDRIEIRKLYSAEPALMAGNESKLHQAMLNIFTNSVQAIEKEGMITISIQNDKKNIVIFIEDTGCGISNEDLPRIFDPFYTTKEPGKGTGLGLSITYNIIKEHKGTIEFSSEPGVGSRVSINIPVNPK